MVGGAASSTLLVRYIVQFVLQRSVATMGTGEMFSCVFTSLVHRVKSVGEDLLGEISRLCSGVNCLQVYSLIFLVKIVEVFTSAIVSDKMRFKPSGG